MLRIFFVLTFFSITVFAQQIKISGRVFDSSSNEPLPYSSITIENYSLGVYSNLSGDFEIEPPNKHVTLIISCVGYKTEKVSVDSDRFISIGLNPINYLLHEVSVYSKQKKSYETNSLQLQNEQVKNFAGMTKDALRAVQLMPGVSTNNEASAKINVRGGTYDENLVLINGVEVYNPFHLKEAPMASVGIFNIDMVKTIDFSPGGFGAEYGNTMSSLLKIDYDVGSKDAYKGKADISMMDLSLLYSGPITQKSSFNFGIRKSYLDYLLRVANVASGIYVGYYDVQAQIDYEFNSANKLKANFIYSADKATEDPLNDFSASNSYQKISGKNTLVTANRNRNHPANADYSNTLFSIISENTIKSSISSKTIFSIYREIENTFTAQNDSTRYSYKDFSNYWSIYSHAATINENLLIKTFSLKEIYLFQLSPYITLKSGFTYKNIFYDYSNLRQGVDQMTGNTEKYPAVTTKIYPPDPQYNDSTIINTSTYALEGFVQQTYQFSDNIIFEFGFRADYLDIDKQLKFSPRANILYKTPFGFNIHAAWGVYYQPPTFKQLRSSIPSKDNTNFQNSIHYIVGFDKDFGEIFSSKLEFYYKQYADLIPVSRNGDGIFSYGKKLNNASGFAEGFDLQLNAYFDHFFIWCSYGFLISKEKLDGLNQNYYPRFTDQRHTFSAVIDYKLFETWELSIRGFYGSGYAFTPSTALWDQKAGYYKWISGDKNTDHYPAYERVDLRISKEFSLFKNPLLVYIDVLNLFGRENILSYKYTYDNAGNLKVDMNKLFGLIPTLGVSWSF